MDIKEKRALFMELLGKNENGDEYCNSDIKGERCSFRLLGLRYIGEPADLWKNGFPKDCTAYRLKYMVEITNNGNPTFRAYTRDLTGVILRS